MRKINFLAISVTVVALSYGVIREAQAQAPLSCKMQMLLNGMAALERDRGISRQRNTIDNTSDTDLTKHEIKTILDRVYVKGHNQTPDQIKDDVYKRCQSGR